MIWRLAGMFAIVGVACAPIWSTTTSIRYRDPAKLEIAPATDPVGAGHLDGSDGGDYQAHAVRLAGGEPGLH